MPDDADAIPGAPPAAGIILKIKDAAIRVGVSERRLRDMIKANHTLPVLRNGNRYLFDDVAIRAVIESMRVCPAGDFQVPQRGAGPSTQVAPLSSSAAFAKLLSLTAPAAPRSAQASYQLALAMTSAGKKKPARQALKARKPK